MVKNICVYCSSSDFVDKNFFTAAKELGEKIAQSGYGLVYGGSNVGLMGEVARNVYHNKGKVTGVIPQKINDAGIAFPHEIELIITNTMRERKKIMEEKADAFIALPGGFGTLEEISEMIVGKQLAFHKKPLVFLNVDNFYTKLFEFFDEFYKYKFAKGDCETLYHRANTVDEAISYIKNYTPCDNEYWKDKFVFSI